MSIRKIPFVDPHAVYAALISDQDGSCLMEKRDNQALRYSFIGRKPYLCFQVKDGIMKLEHKGVTTQPEGDPFAVIATLQHYLPSEQVFPDGFGGLVGHFSYEAIRYIEEIPSRHFDRHQIPDIYLQAYSEMFLFDHVKQEVIICGFDGELSASCVPLSVSTTPKEPSFESDVTDSDFEKLVLQAREHLLRGDIFQVVLSRSFTKAIQVPPFFFYRTLCQLNPSPYHYFFNYPFYQIVGASPEKHASLYQGEASVYPIAGTRRRSQNDDEVIADLMSDPKEEAEHMMLVDLARNDLGAVSQAGTVKIAKLKGIQKLSHVIHMVSDVRSFLEPELSWIDLLKATFPAGTVSGAPKIRAMQIIDHLETSKRDLYSGIICMIDARGNLDSCIAIRTAIIRDNTMAVRAGAGIVLDSDPAAEAAETRHKARALFAALQAAEEAYDTHHR